VFYYNDTRSKFRTLWCGFTFSCTLWCGKAGSIEAPRSKTSRVGEPDHGEDTCWFPTTIYQSII